MSGMDPRICIIQFPGVNCEYETARALEKAGFGVSIVRWNTQDVDLTSFEGYVLPGGFSYEDRLRAGAIAACEDVVGVLFEQASAGKPILGICNGAQVLVESGLVPGFTPGSVDLALAPNEGMGRDGYYADWVYVRVGGAPQKSVITFALEPGEVMPIPVAHSQGRFTSSDPSLFDRLEGNGQIVLRYCGCRGYEPRGFPEDPNGSERFAAAISNVDGNVVAMMPHPERSAWLRQLPAELASVWAVRRSESAGSWRNLERDGPGARLFRSMKAYIEGCKG